MYHISILVRNITVCPMIKKEKISVEKGPIKSTVTKPWSPMGDGQRALPVFIKQEYLSNLESSYQLSMSLSRAPFKFQLINDGSCLKKHMFLILMMFNANEKMGNYHLPLGLLTEFLFFFENDFVENILRRKSFYVETNKASNSIYNTNS